MEPDPLEPSTVVNSFVSSEKRVTAYKRVFGMYPWLEDEYNEQKWKIISSSVPSIQITQHGHLVITVSHTFSCLARAGTSISYLEINKRKFLHCLRKILPTGQIAALEFVWKIRWETVLLFVFFFAFFISMRQIQLHIYIIFRLELC